MGFGPFVGPPAQDFTLKTRYIRYVHYTIDFKQHFTLRHSLHALRESNPHFVTTLYFNDLAHFIQVPCVTPPCIPLPSPTILFRHLYRSHPSVSFFDDLRRRLLILVS